MAVQMKLEDGQEVTTMSVERMKEPGRQGLQEGGFRVENSRAPEDFAWVLDALIEWLQAPQQRHVRRAFVGWLHQVLIPRQTPVAEVPELEDLREFKTMLAERVKEWEEQWLRKGRQEGGAELLLRLLERKFGPLDVSIRQRIAQADTDRLFAWGERVLTAERLEDVWD
jgi:hypothetical protein